MVLKYIIVTKVCSYLVEYFAPISARRSLDPYRLEITIFIPMDPIDLSSLEGPPIIHRPHSANLCSGSSIPNIQSDYAVFPPGSFNDTPSHPRRPASAEPVPLCREKSPSIPSGVNRHRRDRANIQRLAHQTLGNGMNNGTPERRIDYASARHPSSHHGQSSPPSILNSHLEPERYNTHSRARSASPSHELIWLESQNIWVRAETAVSASPYLNTETRAVGISSSYRVSTLTHSLSMETYFSNSDRESGIATSPPPPYERHIFDQPISSSLVSPGEHPSQMTAQDSVWTVVAGRRAHRAPFGY
ncbi:hypothetical protein BBP40_007856 [Aspergillus hancockii]|nr:hypothetical protein BBP40_007856 [Aspergillus hancockii]